LPYNLIKDQKILKKTIIFLALSSLTVLFFGFLSLYGQDWRDSFFRIRSIAVFGFYPYGENHNLTAEFLNVGTFLLLSLRFLAKKPRFKRLFDILFLLSAFGIIMTFSRSGWIILILQTLVYIWLYLRDEKFKKKDLFAFFIAGILILSPLFIKMASLQENNTSSTENRVLLSEISLEAFSEKPILGYGSGSFIRLVENNIRFRAKYGDPIDSHGSLQKVAAENGFFGLLAWLFLIFYLLILFFKALKKHGLNYAWLVPLLIGSLGGLLFQIFNTSYYKGKVWLPITLSILAIELVENHYEKRRR
jgi:O-antigen ligase